MAGFSVPPQSGSSPDARPEAGSGLSAGSRISADAASGRPVDSAGSGFTSDGNLTSRVKSLALAVGFDLAGVARAVPTPETEYLRDWLARGYGGEMHYIERRVEERVDPRRVLEGVRSIVSVALRYSAGNGDRTRSPSATEATGEIARYARGDDYHEVMRDRLRALEAGIAALVQRPIRMRGYVDTGPVQERVFAARAGLGWIGKNTCLIHPRLGSYVFLAVLLCDLELEPDEPEVDHCGSCRACLDACPTDAFEAAYHLDATRCIAYSTIEVPDAIPESRRRAHGDRLFGCDICQEVCPWNQRRNPEALPDPLGLHERLEPRDEWLRPSLAWILSLDQDSWQRATRHSALRRSRYRGLMRNALVAAGNSADAALRPLVERHARGGDALLAEHAEWALAQLPGA